MPNYYEFSSKEELIRSITFRDGKIFVNAEEIPVAMKGEAGLMGKSGLKGDPPKHEWDGTKIRFQNPDKTWGQWVELRGKDGVPGLKGTSGEKGEAGIPGRNGENGESGGPGVKGDKGDKGQRGGAGISGENGSNGLNGRPGIEPEEMNIIRVDLGLMKDAIERMAERVDNVRDGRDGRDGKDAKNGKDGVTMQGPGGPPGDKGEPGIPPHDWNITLNNVAELKQKMQNVIMKFRKMGVEI